MDTLICTDCDRDYVCESCAGWREGSPVTRRGGETDKDYHYRMLDDVLERAGELLGEGAEEMDFEECEEHDGADAEVWA